MVLNNRTARVGDKFRLDNEPFNIFTVHTISPPGTGGLSFARGPIIGAWLKPGGFGVTIDEFTPNVEWMEREAEVAPEVVDKFGNPLAMGDSVIVALADVDGTATMAARTVTGIRVDGRARVVLELGMCAETREPFNESALNVVWYQPAGATTE